MRTMLIVLILCSALSAYGAVSIITGTAVDATIDPIPCNTLNMAIQETFTGTISSNNDRFGFIIDPNLELGFLFFVDPTITTGFIQRYTLNPVSQEGISVSFPVTTGTTIGTLGISTTQKIIGISHRDPGGNFVARTFNYALTPLFGPTVMASSGTYSPSNNPSGVTQTTPNFFYTSLLNVAGTTLTLHQTQYINAVSSSAVGVSLGGAATGSWVEPETISGNLIYDLHAVGGTTTISVFNDDPLFQSTTSFGLSLFQWAGVLEPSNSFYTYQNNGQIQRHLRSSLATITATGPGSVYAVLTPTLDALRGKIYYPRSPTGIPSGAIDRIDSISLASEQSLSMAGFFSGIVNSNRSQIDLIHHNLYLAVLDTNTQKIRRVSLCS